MTRVYYKEAVGAFIVFDVTRESTFEAVTKWKQDLDAKVQLGEGEPIPCVLLANKVNIFFFNLIFKLILIDNYNLIIFHSSSVINQKKA